jgi:hypothetical protein
MRTDSNKQKSKAQGKRKPNVNKEYGEGNYRASREYTDATMEFVKSGHVDEAAKNAKPRSPQEQEEMRKAEQAGRTKSKGEDPKLYRGSRKSSDLA